MNNELKVGVNRLLVVDDTAANRQLLTNLLTAHGYIVHPASDGELALEFVRTTLPDLILLDIRMPGMDGYEVCRRLKADERTRTVPVIFISILEDERDKVKGFREGAVDYITKPFQQEEVLARIQTHLRLRELTERLEQKVAERTEELAIANQLLRQEITEHKVADEALHRLNRKLRAISDCNEVLVRVEDEQTLLNELCRIICDEAGYRMAWVGYAENDDARSIRPVAWGGVEEGYLEQANITWADTEQGRGPTGIAIRTGKTDCMRDFTTDSKAAPWREKALQRGYRSSIALPLKDENGETFGALTIYSTEPNAFDETEEMRLLEELAGDLAFGITVLRARNARKEAERRIALLSFALDNVREAAFLTDEMGRFHYVNEYSSQVLGYTREELVTMGVADIDPDFPPERLTGHWAELKERGSLTFEGRHMAKGGRIFPVEINANYIEYDGQGYNLALVRDITERKKAENALRLSQFIIDKASIGIMRGDADAKILSANDYWARILGYSQEELCTMSFFDLDTNLTPDSWLEHRKRLSSTGFNSFESVNRRKDGSTFPVEVTVNYFKFGEQLFSCSFVRDITERKRAEEEHLAHLRFLESMDKVNRAIQGANDLETMMSDVLDSVLSIFECDRAYLMYPCDPEAESWVIPMERTTPDYRGANALGVDLSKDARVARKLRLLLSSDGPVNMGTGTPYVLSGTTAEHFNIRSMMAMAVYPKVGKPWEFGIHQCSYGRVWNPEEERLLMEIGHRLADALTSLLTHRDLQESEARYRRIVDTANEGIWMLGDDLLTTFNNARMAEMIGYRTEDMIGRPLTDFIFEEDVPDNHRRMDNRRRGVSEHYERRFRHRNGETVWTQASAVPILDAGDSFKGTFGMFTDITERKRAEEALKISEERFRRLAENALDVIYRMSLPDGAYEYMSPAATELSGYAPEEFYDSPQLLYKFIHPEWRGYIEEEWSKLLQGEMPATYEFQIIHKSGDVRWVNQRNIMIRNEGGRPVAIEGIVTDITERKNSEEKLRKLNEELSRLNEELEQRVKSRTNDLEAKRAELEESQGALINIVEDLNEKTVELEQANTRLKELDRLKSLFIASMSHELRTPLNSIIGFSSILHDEWLGSVNIEQKENLAIIRQSGRHLLNLINDVIDVSKIEAGKIESLAEEFDLRDLIDDAVKLIGKELEEKGLVLRVTSTSQLMLTDRRRLMQCVLNLLSNAGKYSERGSVTVEARIVQSAGATQDAAVAEISVTDTGIGIKEEEVQKLFQPFVRLGSHLASIVPGTGLGLYLSSKLAAEVLKGDILVTSEYGSWSRFTLRVPVRLP